MSGSIFRKKSREDRHSESPSSNAVDCFTLDVRITRFPSPGRCRHDPSKLTQANIGFALSDFDIASIPN